MSNEKKIRDLMARLVSMAPEPPPYPEETPMVRHVTKKERRPALVFVGAAALVVLLAIPLLLMTGGEDPVVAGSSTTTSTTVLDTSTSQPPAPSTTSTVGEATTTTAQPIGGTIWTGVVYLYQEPENSFLGNPALVPLVLEVTAEPGTFSDHSEFTSALGILAETGRGLPDRFGNAIPPDVRVVDWALEDGMVRADMNEAFLDGAGGLLADTTMLNQLIYTLTWMDADASVEFTVQGQPVEAFGSEGISLLEPVDRDTFIDELHLIFLTQPISQFENVYAVSGRANVYEATLTWQILDGAGEVVHDEFTTASCGTGCWGEFGVGVDADLIVPGESSVRLLTYSAEDGSPTNIITVPIPEDGIWQLYAGE